ncbi:MAG: hypothetical protein VYA27_12945, partial [Verrucomicrobiota bacterium]|nr:hypothetical protein [Verrucomicrobiota bacterium]
NDPFVLEQTDAIARRLIEFSTEEAERIDLAYTLTFGRPATTLEGARSRALLLDISAVIPT